MAGGTPLEMSEADAGRTCPYCRFPLKQGAGGVACGVCGAVHHADCWHDNGGCAIMGCVGAGAGRASPVAPPEPRTMKMPAVGLRQPAAVPPPAASAPAPDGGTHGRGTLWLAGGLAAVAVVAIAVAVGVLLGHRQAAGTTATRVNASQSRAETPSDPSVSTGQTSGAQSSASPGRSSASRTSYSGQGFTLGYPQGWNMVEDQAPEQGYVESKWVSPTDPNVDLLIDDTPGYDGTPEEGAESVRTQVEQDSSYNRLSWGSQSYPAGEGWDWQFTDRGDERVDTFFAACGTGYAILGSAPAGEFGQYQQLFSQVTDSFNPSC